MENNCSVKSERSDSPCSSLESMSDSSKSDSEKNCKRVEIAKQSGMPGFLFKHFHSKHADSMLAQLACSMLVMSIFVYLVLEPTFPKDYANWRIWPEFVRHPKKTFNFSQRISYVFNNACYPLLWLLVIEIYKEYLRIISDANSFSQREITLSNQIETSNYIKMTERLHIENLSQFVLLHITQLSLTIDPKKENVLQRMVLVSNTVFILARLIDLFCGNRYKTFTFVITYFPLAMCILLNIYTQLNSTSV